MPRASDYLRRSAEADLEVRSSREGQQHQGPRAGSRAAEKIAATSPLNPRRMEGMGLRLVRRVESHTAFMRACAVTRWEELLWLPAIISICVRARY
jgi:hypothetical protein